VPDIPGDVKRPLRLAWPITTGEAASKGECWTSSTMPLTADGWPSMAFSACSSEGDGVSQTAAVLNPRRYYSPAELSHFILWLLPAILMAVLLCRPFGLNDLGWQLVLGEQMIAARTPFITERIAALHLGEQLVPNAWLAQVSYAAVHKFGGWKALRLLDALLWLAGIYAASACARRNQNRPMATLFAIVIAFIVALPSASIRPQSFASLGFGLFLCLLKEGERSWWATLLTLPLLLLWQNLHPSAPVAFAVAAPLAGARWVQCIWGEARPPARQSIIALFAALVIFATPAAWGIVEFARHNAEASLQQGATEWYPLTHSVNHKFVLVVILSAAITGLVLIRYRADMTLVETLPFLVTLAMSFFAARFILFYAISLVPILSRTALGDMRRTSRSWWAWSSRCIIASVMVAEAVLIPLIAEPGLPLSVLVRLNSRVPAGIVVTDPELGGVVAIAGSLRWRITYDGRYYLYSSQEYAVLQRMRSGTMSITAIEKKFTPVAFALSQSTSAPLIAELLRRPGRWKLEYANSSAAFFSRTEP